MKRIIMLFLLMEVLSITFCAQPVLIADTTQKLISDLFASTSGYGIASHETAIIHDRGGNATYGEITCQGLKTLLDDLKLSKNDRFYDLGSGVGKVCVQVCLSTPAMKVVGIELSPTRHGRARRIKMKMQEKKLLQKGRTLEFFEDSILDANIDDATVVFMCSTCFSESLMKQVTEKLSKINHNLRVLTLKKLPKNEYFTLEKTYNVPMSWSSSSPVYFYRSQKKSVIAAISDKQNERNQQ